MTVIHTGYQAREQFHPLHMRSERWAAAVCHRRAGKTVACVNDLIDAALRHKGNDGRFAYIAPFYAQAKDVAWGYLKRFAGPIPGTEFNEGELRCDLPNGARVRLYGADNYERLRGIYLDGVVLDEYGDMEPRAWSEVIRPALADRKGWAVFIGTPKGRNHFSDLWDMAGKDPAWFRLMLKASESGLLDAEELADAARSMTEDQYAQEFECSFQAAVIGAYYGREMTAAENEKRLTRVPWEPGVPVHTAWDLGIGDSTAIWFAQIVGREVRLIDYLEGSGVGLDWYAARLRERTYVYGDHILPHDAGAKELGTGKTRQETLSSLGVNGTRILSAQRVEDGINAARLLIPKCWFDADKCQRGIDALRNYRREYDDRRQVYRDSPLHDWSSHAADAFRYLAIGMPADNGWGKPLKINTSWVT